VTIASGANGFRESEQLPAKSIVLRKRQDDLTLRCWMFCEDVQYPVLQCRTSGNPQENVVSQLDPTL
jgi:hypothetical protein